MYWDISKSMTFHKREIPLNVDDLLRLLDSYQPENEYQALMEALPFHEPKRARNSINEVQEIVIDCIEILLEKDRYIINAVNYEQVSYQTLGMRLGISATHAWRLKQIAYQHLAEVLIVDGRISRLLRYE